ncbi:TetR/AcrR family transcriptional regulator [Paracoccus liaowanqingii]|uniref:TetR/AcrR family transcriptional regulator n=1 Tax=Paracoccus liaowanqingii TaxID=2560053 RepID=A0A4Z1CEM1_9RHOB|nr:TetR/AcrR family transcriptional regulator [Paracoccus liaowanqingii]TGN50447.1 TetR/AcrR family transcriptional regulator [Paracoccus liaowanqingii]
MRVSRVQAEVNRQSVINVASQLFRQHGFDGIGLKDLMAGAGLTQGAFYKQFASKNDLAVHASARAMQASLERWSDAASGNPEHPLAAVVAFYLSKGHRDELQDGCPIVALSADAARQGPEVKASFEKGIGDLLELVQSWMTPHDDLEARARAMAAMSTMVGAVLLSRSVNDPIMADQFLQAAADSIMAVSERAPEAVAKS